MTKEQWKLFITEIKNNTVEQNKEMLRRLSENDLACYWSYFDKQAKKGLIRFLVERVLYPIGNKEEIVCSCGSAHGYVVEMFNGKTVFHHTVCMNCDTIQSVQSFEKYTKEDECSALTNGTWLSRLAQRLKQSLV